MPTIDGDARSLVALSEVFSSIQGEGPSVGQRALFVRTANCNLSCDWCDTSYSWDWSRYDRRANVMHLSVEDLTDQLRGMVTEAFDTSPGLMIFTGGEPLLQQSALADVGRQMHRDMPNVRIEVETNGTILMSDEFATEVHLAVVSPKLSSSGGSAGLRLRQDVLDDFATRANTVFKFVVANHRDLREVEEIIQASGIPRHRVWLMPLADSRQSLATVSTLVAQMAIDGGLHFSPRLQLDLWGGQRGR